MSRYYIAVRFISQTTPLITIFVDMFFIHFVFILNNQSVIPFLARAVYKLSENALFFILFLIQSTAFFPKSFYYITLIREIQKYLDSILYPLTNVCGLYIAHVVIFYKNQTSPFFIISCLMSCYDRPFNGGSTKEV